MLLKCAECFRVGTAITKPQLSQGPGAPLPPPTAGRGRFRPRVGRSACCPPAPSVLPAGSGELQRESDRDLPTSAMFDEASPVTHAEFFEGLVRAP